MKLFFIINMLIISQSLFASDSQVKGKFTIQLYGAGTLEMDDFEKPLSLAPLSENRDEVGTCFVRRKSDGTSQYYLDVVLNTEKLKPKMEINMGKDWEGKNNCSYLLTQIALEAFKSKSFDAALVIDVLRDPKGDFTMQHMEIKAVP